MNIVMKFIITFFVIVLFSNFSSAQKALSSPDSVLNEISKKLHSLKTLKYKNIRELNYASEKYQSNSMWNAYYNFESADTLAGFKYQVEDATTKQIFNGTECFFLDKKAKAIQINDHPNKNDLRSLPFLYNSLITLKNILPLLINDNAVTKTVTDTAINGTSYMLVTINIGKRRIQNLGNGFDAMKTKSDFIYKIVIQRNTYFPYEVVQINDLNNDFIKTTFGDVETNPDVPDESSWYYSSYTNDYKQAVNKATPQLILVGSLAPQWELISYNNNKAVSLTDFKGQVVLVDFWIKNCGPCIQSVPHLNELQNKFKGEKFKIISINSYDSRSEVGWFCNKHKVDYPVLLDGKAVAEKYGVNGYPVFFIIDKRGKVIYANAGYDETLQSEIEKIIRNEL